MAKRSVTITLPDGNDVILEDVPADVTDAQAQANAFSQLGLGTPETGAQLSLRRARELGAAAATGPARAISGIGDIAALGTDKLKELAGPRGRPTAFGMLMDKYKDLNLTQKVNDLRDMLAGRPLEGDLPATIAQGAVGGLLFPGGPLINAATGGASAGVSEAAGQEGLPPEAQAILGLGAGLGTGGVLAAGKRIAVPTLARTQVADAFKALTPRQRLMTALEGMEPTKMAWQAAPEGTALRTLGEKAAMVSTGKKIQAKLQAQRENTALQGDKAVEESIEKLAGKHVELIPGAESQSVSGALFAQIGNKVYRSYQALKRRFPWVTERQFDELLSKSLKDLIKEMRKKEAARTPGIAGAAAAGSAPQPDEPQN